MGPHGQYRLHLVSINILMSYCIAYTPNIIKIIIIYEAENLKIK